MEKQPLVRFIFLHHVHDTVNALIHITEDNVYLFAEGTCHARYAHRRTECIIVFVVVSHDVHLIRVVHDITQCVCHNTCLDARMLLHSLCLAAEKLRLAADIESDLISAAPEGKVKLCLRLLANLMKGLVGRERKPDGESHRHPLGVNHLTHLIENIELLRDRMIQRSAVKEGHILAVRDAAQEAAETAHPCVDLLTHSEEEH